MKKLSILLFAVIILITPFSFSCKENTEIFSVHFFSLGENDSTVVIFPDGTNVLIDCGRERDYPVIKEYLNSAGIKKIDVLILTHPFPSSVGGANNLVEDFKVEKAYIPYIEDLSPFLDYKAVLDKLSENHTEINTILKYDFPLNTENYALGFLSQPSVEEEGSPYRQLKYAEELSEKLIRNVSPCVYIEYYGVRFIINSDASGEIEDKVVDEFISSGDLLNQFRTFNKIEIADVDFLKVSYHGDYSATTARFLEKTSPNNAIITTGYNQDNRPSTKVIERLDECGCHNVFRTDVTGNIGINIYKNGEYKIKLGNEK